MPEFLDNVDWTRVFILAGVIYSIVLHELAHAVTAFWCGDNTARDLGRITLNPIPNISLVGSIIVPAIAYFFGGGLIFGWAKPVPVVPENYRRRVLVIRLLSKSSEIDADQTVAYILQMIALMNVLLALFNLIPIPPLDGHHVAKYLLPRALRGPYESIGFFGVFLVLGLIYWQGAWLLSSAKTVLVSFHDFWKLFGI